MDYYFISKDDFSNKIKQNEFVEWEEVYPDSFYGTLRSEVERIWGLRKHILFDVDVKGGIKLKRYFGDKALAIFIKAPSIDEIQRRLRERKTETGKSLKIRIDKVKEELTYERRFDITIVNNSIEEAVNEACLNINRFLLK